MKAYQHSYCISVNVIQDANASPPSALRFPSISRSGVGSLRTSCSCALCMTMSYHERTGLGYNFEFGCPFSHLIVCPKGANSADGVEARKLFGCIWFHRSGFSVLSARSPERYIIYYWWSCANREHKGRFSYPYDDRSLIPEEIVRKIHLLPLNLARLFVLLKLLPAPGAKQKEFITTKTNRLETSGRKLGWVRQHEHLRQSRSIATAGCGVKEGCWI